MACLMSRSSSSKRIRRLDEAARCRVDLTRRSSWVGRGLLLRCGRLDAQDAAILVVIDNDVEQLVRSLPHVADTHPERNEQRLAPQLLELLVDEDPIEAACSRNLAG